MFDGFYLNHSSILDQKIQAVANIEVAHPCTESA